MITRLYRMLTHARRLEQAKWDLKHAKSGVKHYEAEVAKYEKRVHLIEIERNEIDYPLPRIVRNRSTT
jgi:hypothetical protein